MAKFNVLEHHSEILGNYLQKVNYFFSLDNYFCKLVSN